jgi:hypothetical protein
MFSFKVQIPKDTKFVFVSDFFSSDVNGGAELTSETIIEVCPDKIFKLHSRDLTQEVLYENRDKFWIFGNFTQVNKKVLGIFSKAKSIKYSIVEYDFKFCEYRVPNHHKQRTGNVCDCMSKEHGKLIQSFYNNSKSVFWMSEKQKEHFLKYCPLTPDKKHFVLSSTFSEQVLQELAFLNTTVLKTKENYGILSGGSWIKGIEQTKKYLSENQIKFEEIPNLPYKEFLKELAKFKKFVFMPADWDTCPRLVIEAKLLGCEIILNDNVLHKDEVWFTGSILETEKYLKNRTSIFWKEIQALF